MCLCANVLQQLAISTVVDSYCSPMCVCRVLYLLLRQNRTDLRRTFVAKIKYVDNHPSCTVRFKSLGIRPIYFRCRLELDLDPEKQR